ncbi:hypothetical protein TVAG_189100 [Trichomonas vaginalis G3]|uniref:Uncharacterized protein n=1 Tax=Trichomonas vaginalis (strain ATCC PRA-98 / G3) TaxID=412133 RepID=A2F330_TRIV3|nr:hypothetical protein TVAGG3_0762190 [Trichomonas vaginalis G3]EAY00694.1 hypothetical protein TVAG_189100 [Trichomonas vaginalis G3]KAI5513278.1 hypothetical protein TVAGG3_0762190 [Trichomonas vaginalis G3]|eukprot:XP_001313623.1 hypothetical protein [Trichomonas vaginalis G3]
MNYTQQLHQKIRLVIWSAKQQLDKFLANISFLLMPGTHDIVVCLDDGSFTTTINDVPEDIKVKEFIKYIKRIPELKANKCNYIVKIGDKILSNDDLIQTDSIILSKEVKQESEQLTQVKKINFRLFCLICLILIESLILKHALVGITAYSIGIIVIISISKFSSDSDSFLTQLSSGIHLFIYSIFPDFQLENAAAPQIMRE